MKWGVLTHVDTGTDAAKSFDDAIRLARTAEDLGYDSFWVAQHRFGAQGGQLPSPLVLLSALARETTTIRLGSASIAVLFEDPRRLLEDAAVVDALSAGRLQLGLGSGSDPVASQAWGMRHPDRHERQWALIDEFLTAARDGVGAGRLPVLPDATGIPARTWVTTGSLEGAANAADRGLGLIVGRRSVGPGGPRAEDARVARIAAEFRSWCGPRSRVALSRPIFVTDHDRTTKTMRNPAPSLLCGESGAVLEALQNDPGIPHADTLLVHTRPVPVPLDSHIENLERLALRVLPQIA